MPIERSLIFCNGHAYDICATVQEVVRVFRFINDDEIFPSSRLDIIYQVFSDYRFNLDVNTDEYIPHIYSGIETPMDLWLAEFGVFDNRLDYLEFDNESVGTFPADDLSGCSNIETGERSDASVISDAEEGALVEANQICIEIANAGDEYLDQDPSFVNALLDMLDDYELIQQENESQGMMED
jgi:hypothetical protein